MSAARNSLLGLDALTFFVADVQTGFGPFIAVYLTTAGWSEAAIGQALSLGTLAAMVSQLPGGALVDRLADKRLAAAAAGVAVAASALLFALAPTRGAVMSAEVLHSFSSAMLGPALAAISLALVGRAALGERLGRNARFASLGNGMAAGLLGLCGTYLSSRAVFWATAALMLPALASLWFIRKTDVLAAEPDPTKPATSPGGFRQTLSDLKALFADGRVLGFAVCVALFHLANAAMMPLAGNQVAELAGDTANLIVAACVVVPQALVALISPAVGRLADRRGSRLVLVAGFSALPLRALLFSVAPNPWAIVAIQILDGVSASAFGIMVPLVAAELTRGTERFNLCLGAFGLATAAGATLSNLVAGYVAVTAGRSAAFVLLAGFGAAAVLAAFITGGVRNPASAGSSVP